MALKPLSLGSLPWGAQDFGMYYDKANDVVYIAGGNVVADITSGETNFWMMDMRTFKVTQLPELPAASASGRPGVTMFENKIHIVQGGGTAHWEYDPATRVLVTKNVTPTSDSTPLLVVGNGKMYKLGSAVHEWDSLADSWTAKTSAPSSVNGYPGFVISDILYVPKNTTGGFQKYDFAGDAWTDLNDTPFNASGSSSPNNMTDYDGKGYFLGITTGQRVSSLLFEIDLSNKTVTLLSDGTGMTPRTGGVMEKVGDALYVIGGRLNGTGNGDKKNEAYDLILGTWSTKADAPTGHDGGGNTDNAGAAAVAVADGKIWMAGGRTTTAPLNRFSMYDTVLNTWSTKAALPATADDHFLFEEGGLLYFFDQNQGNKYDPAGADSWDTTPANASGTISSGNRYVKDSANNLVYMLGAAGNFFSYNTSSDTINSLASIPVSSGTYLSGIMFLEGNFIYAETDNGWWRYDIVNDYWQIADDVEIPVYIKHNNSAVCLDYANNKAYVLTGLLQHGIQMPFEYDVGSDSWTPKGSALPHTIKSNSNGGLLARFGLIYVLGGEVRQMNLNESNTLGEFRQDVLALPLVEHTASGTAKDEDGNALPNAIMRGMTNYLLETFEVIADAGGAYSIDVPGEDPGNDDHIHVAMIPPEGSGEAGGIRVYL